MPGSICTKRYFSIFSKCSQLQILMNFALQYFVKLGHTLVMQIYLVGSRIAITAHNIIYAWNIIRCATCIMKWPRANQLYMCIRKFNSIAIFKTIKVRAVHVHVLSDLIVHK